MNEPVRNILVATVVLLVAAVAFPPYGRPVGAGTGIVTFEGHRAIWEFRTVTDSRGQQERRCLHMPMLLVELAVIVTGGGILAFALWKRPGTVSAGTGVTATARRAQDTPPPSPNPRNSWNPRSPAGPHP